MTHIQIVLNFHYVDNKLSMLMYTMFIFFLLCAINLRIYYIDTSSLLIRHKIQPLTKYLKVLKTKQGKQGLCYCRETDILISVQHDECIVIREPKVYSMLYSIV